MKDHASLVSRPPSGLALRSFVGRAVYRVRRWEQLYRERRALMRLNDAQLRDIGLSRVDVFKESVRPFWDDPFKTSTCYGAGGGGHLL
ncbi:hypothetical protein D9M71_139250 [compost metagenome]